MKRNIISLLLCLLLCSFVLNVSAASSLPLVIDNADLLSNEERIDLEDAAQSLRTVYEMDVVILTEQSLNGKSAQSYADDYYDENGYGYGENYSGLMFLLAMEEREWYISTCGDAIYAFSDYGLDMLGEQVVPYLSAGAYYEGFSVFLDTLPDYFEAYQQNDPIDDYHEPYYPEYRGDVVYYEPQHEVTFWNVLPTSLLIGIVVAIVVILIMRSGMNTKKKQYSAGDYLKQGSYHLRRHQDMFLYSQVSKVRRQQNTSSSGGGSSVHRGSSGRSHDGRGGRF